MANYLKTYRTDLIEDKIGDTIKTEDIFINDDLFSDTDQQDILDFVDEIRSEIDVNDTLFEHEPIDTTPPAPLPPSV